MRIFIAGGAGFIGSHFAHYLHADPENSLTIYDNFSSGQRWHLAALLDSPRLAIVEGDLKDLDRVTASMAGHDIVYHFASNPDIAKAMSCPNVDFWEGTYLTQNLLDAIRVNKVANLIYASGSGVYGETGTLAVTEDHSPMLPISPYGASKLACEVTIHAYCKMFGLQAHVFRFANVVGPRQTHGVTFDFVRKLKDDPSTLRILGDGSQSKSYIHVSDIIRGIQYFFDRDKEQYNYYHLATGDYITVREIADLVVETMGLTGIRYDFTGGDRGWAGDVPMVRFDLAKVAGRGWSSLLGSREALRLSIVAMLSEIGYPVGALRTPD